MVLVFYLLLSVIIYDTLHRMLILLLLLQSYGWNAYPPGYTRTIFNDDMTQSANLQAIPIANLGSNQKLPLLIKSIPRAPIKRLAFTIKPATAGTITVSQTSKVNSLEFVFVPNKSYRGLGLINVSAFNSKGETVIGQIHFMVRAPVIATGLKITAGIPYE